MEEVVFKMSPEGTASWWQGGGRVLWGLESLLPGVCRGVWVRVESQAGAVNALVTASPSLWSLTLFPFLPGSSAPSLAALRDMTVSTSTPPQTSLSALKSSGT